jgi:V/A-type H+-transporting ATPase subunit D
MPEVRLTKNELKVQKDALRMYERYLPTLQLKKRQLQSEIRTVESRRAELSARRTEADRAIQAWAAVFAEQGKFTPGLLEVASVATERANVAGVDIPVFRGVEFRLAAYDLFGMPLWVDRAARAFSELAQIDLELRVVGEQLSLLAHELSITTQRVNLFEKVKIPETRAHIRRIQVYLGDQQTAAVVRGKIAKAKLLRTTRAEGSAAQVAAGQGAAS